MRGDVSWRERRFRQSCGPARADEVAEDARIISRPIANLWASKAPTGPWLLVHLIYLTGSGNPRRLIEVSGRYVLTAAVSESGSRRDAARTTS